MRQRIVGGAERVVVSDGVDPGQLDFAPSVIAISGGRNGGAASHRLATGARYIR